MTAPETQGSEGFAKFDVPAAGKECQTWYSVYGDLKAGVRPLVCLHGGPGIPHDYLSPIKNLAAAYSIPVVMYDQLGCGRSTHLQEKNGDEAFWTVDLFLAELDNLLVHLGIRDDYDLLGQSWGGMLGAEHAIRQPKGLNKFINASGPASVELFLKATAKLRAELPQDIQDTLTKHEQNGTTDSEEYEEAMMVFYDRHTCRIKPMPEELMSSFAYLKEDNTVYNTMNGPSEFHVIGSLKTFSVVDRIHQIKVPTLLINGKYDEATDEVMEPFFKIIEKVKWIRFAESSHMPHLEEAEEYLKVLNNFLK
ncbi:hypothetical protein BP6252_01635 [Coleophoma cylindrospora]|uniref:AB hydrolase-1 domain-containing protein n=1 Tax=Coleophoma cylindrospora TaxID=1849047 RepID=A0A3D8STG4_9HELO|nr:hypothetical protein BP6252_01635 [Coleophoma cylindrospora]